MCFVRFLKHFIRYSIDFSLKIKNTVKNLKNHVIETKLNLKLYNIQYLAVILRTRVVYELIADEAR